MFSSSPCPMGGGEVERERAIPNHLNLFELSGQSEVRAIIPPWWCIPLPERDTVTAECREHTLWYCDTHHTRHVLLLNAWMKWMTEVLHQRRPWNPELSWESSSTVTETVGIHFRKQSRAVAIYNYFIIVRKLISLGVRFEYFFFSQLYSFFNFCTLCTALIYIGETRVWLLLLKRYKFCPKLFTYQSLNAQCRCLTLSYLNSAVV